MARKKWKKHSPEQIVAILRQIEVEVANHKPTGQACREAGITEQTYYRWRKEYGGLKLEQARRMKQLEKENARLRRKGVRNSDIQVRLNTAKLTRYHLRRLAELGCDVKILAVSG